MQGQVCKSAAMLHGTFVIVHPHGGLILCLLCKAGIRDVDLCHNVFTVSCLLSFQGEEEEEGEGSMVVEATLVVAVRAGVALEVSEGEEETEVASEEEGVVVVGEDSPEVRPYHGFLTMSALLEGKAMW